MPFTFCHPAIVLPLYKAAPKYASLTGLVVGSMAPDFEYFIKMCMSATWSHSISGFFYFDLPVGLAAAFLFHNVARNMLFNNLPAFFQKRFLPYQNFSFNKYFWSNWYVVIASILVGAASHLFWDSFTHGHRFFVGHIAFLRKPVGSGGLFVFDILQDISSIAGFIVIAIFIYNMPAKPMAASKISPFYWLLIFAFVGLVMMVRFWHGLNLKAYGNIAATAISGFLMALVVVPAIMKWRNK